jgi:hypothetical protein
MALTLKSRVFDREEEEREKGRGRETRKRRFGGAEIGCVFEQGVERKSRASHLQYVGRSTSYGKKLVS